MEKLAGIMLLGVLGLAVFPMEQPGMLGNWYGTKASFIFTTKFLKLGAIEILLGGALVFSYLHYTATHNIRYKNNFGLVIIFFVVCIMWGYFGTLFSDKVLTLGNMGFVNWKKLAYGMILFSVLTLYLDSRKKIEQTLLAIALACIVLDVYGLGRYFISGGLKTEKYIGNVVFWETVKLGLNVFVLILSTGMLLFNSRKLKPRWTMIYRIALVLAALVIFLSSRRTSMIMAMVAGCIYLWLMFRSGKKGLAIGIIAAGLTGVLLMVAINYETFETKFLSRITSVQGVFDDKVDVDAGSTQGHMQELITGWEIVKENPVWGVGFAWVNETVFGQQTQEQRYWVHNSVLTFWMRFGIFGVITYFYLYYKIFSVLWKTRQETRAIIPTIFLIWFFVEFLSGLFFPPFFGYFKSSALFFGTLAIANAYMNVMRRETYLQAR